MKRILIPAAIVAAVSTGALAHEIIHSDHGDHSHGADCGHAMLDHDGHLDYIHAGHLHSAHGDHTDEHALAITSTNPGAHELSKIVNTDSHPHGHKGEEHMMVQHGTHMDYIHDGRLHHVHGDHTDDHGPVKVIKAS